MADEEKTDEATPEEDPGAKANFKKGMGLLFQAAKSVADDIKREVDKGGVKDSLKQAGRELEEAAQQAAKALEDFIDRNGPGDPSPDYTDKWPPDATDAPKAKQADADIPKDGGTDPTTGEKRDMRIQVDDD